MVDKYRVEALLKRWCDALLAHQIDMPHVKASHGGFICPSCVIIHGRIADSVYPLTYMYSISSEEKYLAAAVKAVEWCERNVLCRDGAYANDKNKVLWICTTAFCQASIGKVLSEFGTMLPQAVYDKWSGIFKRQTAQIYSYFNSPGFNAVTNYQAQYCLCMALAHKILGTQDGIDYKKTAYDRYKLVTKFFTSEGLLYGEGNADLITENGSRCFDIGYNVEESLPALIGFADIMNDRVVMIDLSKKFKAHLEFMLPDGAWDGSWCSRSFKWTYWGSRTSDGAQGGLVTLARHTGDAVFEKAAILSFELYERCTTSYGLLAGGLMYEEAGEEACIHHTFCHAKVLCELHRYLSEKGAVDTEAVKLPGEQEYGVKSFSTANVSLISHGKWRATISGNDYAFTGNNCGGGTLSLAWHKDVGAVTAKSMSKYTPIEPLNMQFQRHADGELCMTPRIVYLTEDARFSDSHGIYSSDNAKNAQINVGTSPSKEPVITVDGMLRDNGGNELSDGSYRFTYSFEKRTDSIAIKISTKIGGFFSIPVIASSKDKVTTGKKCVYIERNGKTIEVSASNDLEFGFTDGAATPVHFFENMYRGEGEDRRAFCTVGGFMYVPFTVRLDKGKAVYVRISVK